MQTAKRDTLNDGATFDDDVLCMAIYLPTPDVTSCRTRETLSGILRPRFFDTRLLWILVRDSGCADGAHFEY